MPSEVIDPLLQAPFEIDPVYQRMRRGLLAELARIEAGGTPERAYSIRGERRLAWRPTPKFHRLWSDYEKKHLIEMHGRGISASKIAAELKRSYRGVREQIWRMQKAGTLPRRWRRV